MHIIKHIEFGKGSPILISLQSQFVFPPLVKLECAVLDFRLQDNLRLPILLLRRLENTAHSKMATKLAITNLLSQSANNAILRGDTCLQKVHPSSLFPVQEDHLGLFPSPGED